MTVGILEFFRAYFPLDLGTLYPAFTGWGCVNFIVLLDLLIEYFSQSPRIISSGVHQSPCRPTPPCALCWHANFLIRFVHGSVIDQYLLSNNMLRQTLMCFAPFLPPVSILMVVRLPAPIRFAYSSAGQTFHRVQTDYAPSARYCRCQLLRFISALSEFAYYGLLLTFSQCVVTTANGTAYETSRDKSVVPFPRLPLLDLRRWVYGLPSGGLSLVALGPILPVHKRLYSHQVLSVP